MLIIHYTEYPERDIAKGSKYPYFSTVRVVADAMNEHGKEYFENTEILISNTGVIDYFRSLIRKGVYSHNEIQIVFFDEDTKTFHKNHFDENANIIVEDASPYDSGMKILSELF